MEFGTVNGVNVTNSTLLARYDTQCLQYTVQIDIIYIVKKNLRNCTYLINHKNTKHITKSNLHRANVIDLNSIISINK